LVKHSRREVKRRFQQHRRFIRIAELLVDSNRYDDALLLAERVATNAMYNYAGFYTDGAFENLVVKIGNHCLPQPSIKAQPNSQRIVHVVSTVGRVGGHGRLLQEWVARDTLHVHRVVVTQQTDAGNEFFGADELIQLDAGAGLLAKAAALQTQLTDAAFIVLHHSSNDLVPLLALSSNFIKAPVAVLNHADHLPWAGSSVCDYLIEIREGFLPLDKERRQISAGGYLPIPVTPVQAATNRAQSRELLGIAPDAVVLLTVASAYKFAPIGAYHFFEDIIPVLNQYPQAILYVVGIAAGHELAVAHPQIVYAGVRTDTAVFKQAADVYVESFPFASFTSLLETAINGTAFQLMYHPPLISKMETVNAEEQLIWHYPATKTEWVESLGILISNTVYRTEKATMVSALVRQIHFQNWSSYLQQIYTDLKGHAHVVRRLADTPFTYTADEYYLSCLQANLFALNSSYQMVPLPLNLRFKLVQKWITKSQPLTFGDLFFLFRFVAGKC
jgi:hypothetical protein